MSSRAAPWTGTRLDRRVYAVASDGRLHWGGRAALARLAGSPLTCAFRTGGVEPFHLVLVSMSEYEAERRSEERILVMWCEWSRRWAYEAEFRSSSRYRTRSRQNRDRIRPWTGDLAAAHLPVLGALPGERSTAREPDPVGLDRCLGACRTEADRCSTTSLVSSPIRLKASRPARWTGMTSTSMRGSSGGSGLRRAGPRLAVHALAPARPSRPLVPPSERR